MKTVTFSVSDEIADAVALIQNREGFTVTGADQRTLMFHVGNMTVALMPDVDGAWVHHTLGSARPASAYASPCDAFRAWCRSVGMAL